MNRFSAILLLAALLQSSRLFATPDALGVVVFAEKPLKMIRATTLYAVSSGTHLQSGDLLESQESVSQIEGLAANTLALGPKTRVYLQRKGGSTHIYLLEGWLKIQPSAGASNRPLAVDTGRVRVDLNHGAGVVHASASLIEVFVENGSLILTESGAKKPRTMSLLAEQYAQRKGEEPLQPAGRPPGSFISAMPKAFFDPLVQLAVRPPAAVIPKKIRDIEYVDIAPLLHAPGLDNASMARRFSARLTNPAFRKAIVREMGGSFAWEHELFRLERKRASQ